MGVKESEGGPAVRRLCADDFTAWRALRLRALRDHPEAFGSSFDEESARPIDVVRARFDTPPDEGGIFGAHNESGQLIGMAGIMRETGRKMRHKAFIWGMYVTPEARGQGVGEALLGATLAIARAWPVEQVTLMVVTANEGARRLYERLGFAVYGTEPRALRLDDRYLDEHLMVAWMTTHLS